MKIKMLDGVEAPHMMIAELEPGKIREQAGLTIKSRVKTTAHGMKAVNYIVGIAKDATVEVPNRLGKRLIGFKFAKAAQK